MLGAFNCELENNKIKFTISGMNDSIRRNQNLTDWNFTFTQRVDKEEYYPNYLRKRTKE